MERGTPSEVVRLAALALGAITASGCIHHRCPVPPAVVEAVPGGKLPLAVAVRTTARANPSEVFGSVRPLEYFGFDPVPPTREMVARVAASVFERVVPEEPGGATPPPAAVLELRVEGARVEWSIMDLGPYEAAIAYRAALRTPDGAAIATVDLTGTGSREPPLQLSPQCTGIGDAAALAVEDAGAKVVAWLGSDPAIAAWLGGRGIAAPALVTPRARAPVRSR